VSPTVPTFATLNDQLNQAHRRVRELQARERELLAQNRALRAVIAAFIQEDHRCTAAEHTSSPNDGTAGRFCINADVRTKQFPYV
jgi:hypothetical protein